MSSENSCGEELLEGLSADWTCGDLTQALEAYIRLVCASCVGGVLQYLGIVADFALSWHGVELETRIMAIMGLFLMVYDLVAGAKQPINQLAKSPCRKSRYSGNGTRSSPTSACVLNIHNKSTKTISCKILILS